MPEDMLWEHF